MEAPSPTTLGVSAEQSEVLEHAGRSSLDVQRLPAAASEPSDEELLRAMVAAELRGDGACASRYARTLDRRERERAGNVVALSERQR